MAVVSRWRVTCLVAPPMVSLLVMVLVGAHPVPALAEAALRGPNAEAGAAVRYRPPVTGVVVDPFRAPATPYGPGNRGLDYAVAPLAPVRAAADGEVIFAGAVAGTLHVTIRRADGLRSSYSFLASVSVATGQVVRAGDEIGRSTEVFHFGVRDPAGTYLDPAALFAATGAHLVPGGDDGAGGGGSAEPAELATVVADRRGPVEAVLSRALAARRPGVPLPGIVERTRLWGHLLAESSRLPHDERIRAGLARWVQDRAHCTPVATAPPPVAGRRILVEVGGIGSTSEQAAVSRVDHAALGYEPGDVLRFSYGGGRVPVAGAGGGATVGPAALNRIPASSYTAVDSQMDLRVAAERLADLLRALATAEPGVPIDVVGHSQGGVVARLAMTGSGRAGPLPPSVATLVTLGAPHQGADLAAVVQAGRLGAGGRQALATVREGLGLELDPDLPAAAQLAPTSTVIDELRAQPPPRSVRVVSVAARDDLVAPTARTTLAGASSVVVSVGGAHAHDRLPGSPEATREIALAIAAREPTCRSFSDALTDVVVGERIAQAESRLGLAVAAATTAAAGAPEPILVPGRASTGAPAPRWLDGPGTQYTRSLARRMPGCFTTTSSPGSTHGHVRLSADV
jgi:hypothetical protein